MAIYAVFFETGDGVEYLDGTNSLTSDHIVLLAELKNGKETNEWTHFSIPFKPVVGRTIDKKKLKNGKYSLAIIMSSSKDGAVFNGAVGSTLYVDELKLYSE
jgi:lipoprotein